jgi:hypothetical protein
MNTFKRKSLYAALAGVSALGVTGAAQAVNLNSDGLGQVLIYPRKRMAAINREPQTVSRIIPGNWGKAGPGWLARPL